MGWTLAIQAQISGAEGILVSDDEETRVHYARLSVGIDARDMTVGTPLFSLRALLRAIAAEAGVTSDELIAETNKYAVSISGIDHSVPTSVRVFIEQMERLGFAKGSERVCTLPEAAHRAAFVGGSGLLVRCGHGSSLCMKDEKATTRTFGGWGTVIGDCGSGFCIGRDVVHTVTTVLDELGDPTQTAFVSKLPGALARVHDDRNVKRTPIFADGSKTPKETLGEQLTTIVEYLESVR